MRWLLALVPLIATPALAEVPHCALPGPIAVASADVPPAATAPAGAAKPVAPPSSATTQPVPPGLANMPFIARVAASGATLFDLGVSHGLHLAAARNNGEFRMFAVLPDGLAAVEGAPVELGVPQLTTIAAGDVTTLGAQAGFAGYFVRSGQQFQVFYAAPDNMVVVPGILRDAQGRNLTKSQVASIPGAVPTVEVSADAAPPAAPIASVPPATPVGTEASLAAVQRTAYGTAGPASAPQLFMLADPQCIYSVRAYQQLRSFADAKNGRIRLSVVPLSVLDYEDHGQSTRSALALLSKPAEQLLAAWQSGDVAGPVTPEAAAKLKGNMAIAEAIGLKGTPTFIWRKTDGSVGRIDGVPTDIGALVASVGS